MSFLTQNKIRPGAYINFYSTSTDLGEISERGIVALPLSLDFLPEHTMIKTDIYTDFLSEYGVSIANDMLLYIKEAYKNAETVYIYRLNSGEKASALCGSCLVSANFSGSYGNNIAISITKNTDFTVKTYIDDYLFNSQTVLDASELIDNNLVSFDKTAELEVCEKIYLEGGISYEEDVLNYENFFELLKVMDFNTVGVLSTDISIKELTISFVKEMRETHNQKIQGVISEYNNPDYEGIINVCNGVVLDDGTIIPANGAVAYVSGAVAGASINESLTYKTYQGAVDAYPRYTSSVIEEMLTEGKFIFTHKRSTAVIEKDINSFVSFSSDKSDIFSKNRVIRILDNIAEDIKTIFEDYYLGKVSNNEFGRSLFASECINYLRNLEEISCIENFDAINDIKVLCGEDVDSITVYLNLTPIDSIEKLYMTVYLN